MNTIAPGPDAVLEAALRGDAPGAIRATRQLARSNPSLRSVQRVLDAAINFDNTDFIEAAAALAVMATLPPEGRIQAAWRFAIAGFAQHALSVLLSDPCMLVGPAAINRTLNVLHIVQSRAAPNSIARTQAAALSNRLLPVEDPPAIASDRAFVGDPAATPKALGAPVAVSAAPNVPSVISTEVAKVLADFERTIARAGHPKIRVYPDVFVNRLGQIWSRDGRLFRTYGKLVPDASRQAETTAPVVEEAALAVEIHNNIFHWFAEWFPTLAWRLDDAACTIPFLVRDDAARFVDESLALGSAGPVATVGTGDAVFVRRLHVADRDLSMLARHEAVGPLMTRLRHHAAAQFDTPRPDSRGIYISRRDSPKRALANEAALEQALSHRGFDILTMSELSFAEQIARVSDADVIVAPHGAGLALLAAARPGRRVLEALPALRGGMALRTCMARISRMVGHQHHLWLETEPPAGARWSISVDAFLAELDRISDSTAVATGV